MVNIDTGSDIEGFRRFLISSTCLSFIPESYLADTEVFPEKEGVTGSIYVEAADKVTLRTIRDITFINARDILGIIYNSKSGNTQIKWRQIREDTGRVTGEASGNSLVNLLTARVITEEYAAELTRDVSTASSDQVSIENEEPTAEGGSPRADVEAASTTSETPDAAETPRIGDDA